MRALALLLALGPACRAKDLPAADSAGNPGFDSDAPAVDSDTGGDPVVDPEATRLCPSSGFTAEGAAPILWGRSGEQLVFLRADGEPMTAWTFSPPEGAPADLDLELAVSITGQYIAAVGAFSAPAEPTWGASTLVLFDRSGAALASSDEGGSTSTTLRVGTSGVVAYDRGHVDNDPSAGRRAGLLMAPDGALTELDGWTPVSPPDDEGWLVACALEGSPCAWVRPGDAPRHAREVEARQLLGMPGFMVTFTEPGDPEGPALSVSTPDEAELIDLSAFFPEIGVEALRPLHVKPEGWVLIGHQPTGEQPPDLGAVLKLNLRQGSAESVDLTPPEGQDAFWHKDCPSPLVQVSSAGELLVLLEDGAQGAVWSAGLRGEALAQRGQAVTGVWGLWPVEHAGTAQLLASTALDSPCPSREWAPSEAEEPPLEGDSVQIVLNDGAGPTLTLAPHRGDAGRWPLRPLMFNSDGTCGLYDDPELPEGQVTLLDAPGGERVALPAEVEGWSWLY